MSVTHVKAPLGDKEVIIETGRMARQAGGAVTVRCGDTIVLVTATADTKAKEECDFLPLTVEYLEKTFAAGKIPGGFFKREGRPSESAILTARFIDRPIRPLFPENYFFETQVIAIVLSASPECPPETLATIGASAALGLSDIPFKKILAGCRVSRVKGEFKINASLNEVEGSDLNLVVAATEDAVVMVEGEGREVSEKELVEAIEFAQKSLQPVIAAQRELFVKAAKAKREIAAPEKMSEISKAVAACRSDVVNALTIKEKLARYTRLNEIKKGLVEKTITEDSPYAHKLQLLAEFEELKSTLMRGDILAQDKRIDGRTSRDIRPITAEVGFLPRAHGSALFTRGETQALVAATLGTSEDEQIIDGLLAEKSKKFMLNYNFPAFSVGEVKPLRSPGRREIGHGYLAERALQGMLPSEESFPYTIRIVSEILESNGSSSMATVCGGALALMDAGVPIKAPVAGIAMGLIKEGEKFAILSDILGDEDHLGDMDFKVTGTENGVTALQMDIKIEGINSLIMSQALAQARDGRLHILGKMREAIESPRPQIAPHAPQLEIVRISPGRIKDLIGPGGKNIKHICETTGAKIDIDDSGVVHVFSCDRESLGRVLEMVHELTEEVEVGKLYTGKVKKIADFGAFVEVLPKIEGLLHISQISNRHVRDVSDVLRVGDVVTVKVLHIDDRGKMKLSMKDVEQQKAG